MCLENCFLTSKYCMTCNLQCQRQSQFHHTRERPALHLPCCVSLDKPRPLSGLQSPRLCNQRGWPYICCPFQFLPLSEMLTRMLALALLPSPLPKRGKETCVRCPGRVRSSELSGCAGCCLVSKPHTNPKTESPSSPVTTATRPHLQPKHSPRPRQGPPLDSLGTLPVSATGPSPSE